MTESSQKEWQDKEQNVKKRSMYWVCMTLTLTNFGKKFCIKVKLLMEKKFQDVHGAVDCGQCNPGPAPRSSI